MSPIIVGEKQRPRVALIGYDEEKEEHQLILEWLQKRFPTVWHGYYPGTLEVHQSEIDLTITLSGGPDLFAQNHHLISFDYNSVPGPCDHTCVKSDSHSLRSEYYFPDNHSLPIDKRRKADLSSLGSARGLNLLKIKKDKTNLASNAKILEAQNKLVEGALAIAAGLPIATIYIRENDKGVAVLPLNKFDKTAWIDILVDEWSKIDPESFPDGGGEWSKTPEWMAPEERGLVNKIDGLEAEKKAMMTQLDSAIADK
ncbi:MAG: hypothetical protein O7G87_12505, partial [bacterium]|nr:hypothetical protein [bacterium]